MDKGTLGAGGRVAPRAAPASIHLPVYVPDFAVLGIRGKVMQRLEQLSGAKLRYLREEHRVDIHGSGDTIKQAAQLVDRNVRQYLLTRPKGANNRRRDLVNILSESLQHHDEFVLSPYERPLLHNLTDGAVFAPAGSAAQSSAVQEAQQRDSAGQDKRNMIEDLTDSALDLAIQSPIDYDEMSVTFNLGKGVLKGHKMEYGQSVPRHRLQKSLNDLVFDANLTQESVKALDQLLLTNGIQAGELGRSVTLQLLTSIPWVQYHTTFDVGADGSSLVLKEISAESHKAAMVTVLTDKELLDYRIRVLAKGHHLESDPITQSLQKLAAAGEFTLINNTRVSLPESLQQMDLSLYAARVKVKRTYRGKLPKALHAAPPPPGLKLPPPTVDVTVSAVVDNSARKRLEVLATCPELNAYLLKLHAGQAPAGAVAAAGGAGGEDVNHVVVRHYLASMVELMKQVQASVPAHLTAGK